MSEDFSMCEGCKSNEPIQEHEGEWLCLKCIRENNQRDLEEMDDVSNLMGG